MTGGQAFVYDPSGELPGRLNTGLVEATRPEADSGQELRWLVEQHLELTGSRLAASILEEWDASMAWWWHVRPIERTRQPSEAVVAARARATV